MKITHQPNATFSYSEIENVTCLIEAMNEMENAALHPRQGKTSEVWITAGQRFLDLRGNHGSFTLRAAVASLADECQTAWNAVTALTNDEPPCFDFEFCYDFLIGALDNGLLRLAIDLQYTPSHECQAKVDNWFCDLERGLKDADTLKAA